MEMDNRQKNGYRWVIAVLSFLMVMISLGFCSSTRSLYISPITSALNIKRGVFSVCDSLRYVTTAIVNVFFGFLVSRYKIKKLIITGFASLMASQIVFSFADDVLVFYIGGILLGIGFALTSTTMVGCIVNRWYKKSKGKIMGAVLAANGIGGAVAIQTVSPIIESGVFGYRLAYRVTAVILLAVCILLLFFFKDKPAEENELPDKQSQSKYWTGIKFEDAVKMPYFYGAIICIFLTGFVLQGVTGVAAAHMKDIGIDPAYIVTVLSIHSLLLTLSKVTTGHIYDRFGLKPTINFCSALSVLIMIILAFMTNSHTGRIFAMLYGILSSFALPLETVILPIYAGDLFGQKSFDKMLGIFVSANVTGYALGAPAINACYDLWGSYKTGFIICSVIMAVTIIALQFVIKASHKMQIQ